MLVIIHQASDLPHLQGDGSLKRGGVLVETGWMSLIEWGMWGENWQTWRSNGVHRTQGRQRRPQRLLGQILQV
jgi:hypothetical protein